MRHSHTRTLLKIKRRELAVKDTSKQVWEMAKNDFKSVQLDQ